MMRLTARQRTPRDADVVPMINVAFLLLVFLLMVSVLTPPDPVEITPPLATAPEAERRDATLYVAADGTTTFEGLAGDAAFAQLPDGPLSVMADQALPARDLARVMARLATEGVASVTLITAPR